MDNSLLQMQFTVDGCVNPNIYCMGGVDFNTPSSLRNGLLKCAFFKPYNDNAGFYTNSSDVSNHLCRVPDKESDINSDFTIYFRYKIDINCIDDIAPIVSCYDRSNDKNHLVLYIENKRFFTWLMYDYSSKDRFAYYSSDIEYTLDNDWHTFCLTRKKDLDSKDIIYRFFIDGVLSRSYKWLYEYNPDISTIFRNIFIGWYTTGERIYTINNGYLDDFNILSIALYDDNFKPTTNYLVLSNGLYDGRYETTYDDDLLNMIADKKKYTLTNLIDNQIGWLPRKSNISWSLENGYFKTQDEYVTSTNSDNTATISIVGLSDNLSYDTAYYEDIYLSGLEKGDLLPIMVFINGYFCKLSDITIIKVYDNTTLVIKNVKYSKLHTIDDFRIISLPFSIIYEEDIGENTSYKTYIDQSTGQQYTALLPNYTVLYSFDNDGRFTISNASIFYYISEEYKDRYIIKSIEDDIPLSYGQNTNEDIKYQDNNFFHSVWRYGNFEPERILTNPGSTVESAHMYFRAWDNGSTKPGDHIILYKGTDLISPDKYDIVGYDLIKFYDKNDVNDNSLFTMQIITDFRSGENMVYLDNTDSIILEVVADQVKQSYINIPITDDLELSEIESCIIYKNGKLCYNIENSLDPRYNNTYKIDIDNKILEFVGVENFCNIGDIITFIFIKTNLLSVNGTKYMRPIYLKVNNNPDIDIVEYIKDPKQDNVITTGFLMPDYGGLTFNMNNFFLTINGQFIAPNRYRIQDNIFHEIPFRITTNPYDSNIEDSGSPEPEINIKELDDIEESIDRFKHRDKLVFMSEEDNDLIIEDAQHSKDIILCLLRIVDPLYEPILSKDNVLAEQLSKGRRFVLYDMNIDKKYRVTLDNLICFDQDGKYISDLYGYIYNMNIIKSLYTSSPNTRVVKYLTCLYYILGYDKNYSNVTKFENEPMIKRYIRLQEEFPDLDDHFDNLISDFDFKYSNDLTKEENIIKSFDYMVTFNQNIFDDLFEKRSKTYRTSYTGKDFNDKLTKYNNKYRLDQSIYPSGSKSIFFEDGKLADWNNDISYDENGLYEVYIDSLLDTDTSIESITSLNMNNDLISLIDDNLSMRPDTITSDLITSLDIINDSGIYDEATIASFNFDSIVEEAERYRYQIPISSTQPDIIEIDDDDIDDGISDYTVSNEDTDDDIEIDSIYKNNINTTDFYISLTLLPPSYKELESSSYNKKVAYSVQFSIITTSSDDTDYDNTINHDISFSITTIDYTEDLSNMESVDIFIPFNILTTPDYESNNESCTFLPCEINVNNESEFFIIFSIDTSGLYVYPKDIIFSIEVDDF